MSLEFQQKAKSQAGVRPEFPSEKWCREADPALKALESREQYWRQNDPSGLASLLVARFAPLGASDVLQIQDLEMGPRATLTSS